MAVEVWAAAVGLIACSCLVAAELPSVAAELRSFVGVVALLNLRQDQE